MGIYTIDCPVLVRSELPSPNSLDIGHSPAGSIDNNTREAPGNDTSDRKGDNPTEVDPRNHTPVDGSPGTIAKTDTDGGTSDTLRRGNRELCI